MKMSEARSKRVAEPTVTSAQQVSQPPPPPPQKRMRFTNLRIRPLGELLDGFQTDEHILHALNRPATVEDYGGAESFVNQLLNLALVNTASSLSQQSRPAAEVAIRALRLLASSHSPLYSASVIQTIFDRCLTQAVSAGTGENSAILSSKLLSICAECAKSVTNLQQQFISTLVEILAKADCDFALVTESLRILGRFFPRECSTRYLIRLCSICVDLLLVGDVRIRLDTLDLLNEMLKYCTPGHSITQQIPIEALYRSAVLVLDDRFEDVRLASLDLITYLASLRPEMVIDDKPSTSSNATNNTLANTVFSHLCNACASDRAIRVRALAAKLMGKLPGVSENYIEQSLEKKAIASMRLDGGADQPQKPQRKGYGVAVGDYEVDAVSVISQSACGALVHALEDEFYEVREAGVESLSRMITPERMAFARQGQEFLIDALGDEIEIIVICALRALARAGSQLEFTEKQVTAILFTLKVASPVVRRQVHRTLSSIRLCSRSSHLACCLALLENIRMFPSDVDSIWECCCNFGRNHPELTRANVSRLIDIHPIFLSQEAKMDDPAYIAKLLIIFAAAGPDGSSSQIMRALPNHTRSHYDFVCGRFRHLLFETGPSSSTALVATSPAPRAHLEGVIKRYIELLRSSLLSSPSFDRSVELISNLTIGLDRQNSSSNSTALTRNSRESITSDTMGPQWRFVMGIIQCLFDYRKIRRIAASASSSDSSTQTRSILINELRPRIIRLINCFMPVPSSFIAFLRLIDVAASSAVEVDPKMLLRIASLARLAFESSSLSIPNVLERLMLTLSESNYGSNLAPRLAQFDEAIVSALVSSLSSDEISSASSQMTQVNVEIREPMPMFGSFAAEVRFVSHFGATVPLRFIATGFRRPSNSMWTPRLVIRVTYPNQRSDQLVPLSNEIEVVDENPDGSFSLSVSMQVPIAFAASTGPCHARLTVLLSSPDDSLVDLMSLEYGGSGHLKLLVHSKAGKGEPQKRLLAAQQ